MFGILDRNARLDFACRNDDFNSHRFDGNQSK